jgi:hypothetical protein
MDGALVLASTTGCTPPVSSLAWPAANNVATAQQTKVTASPSAKAGPTPTAANSSGRDGKTTFKLLYFALTVLIQFSIAMVKT